MSLRCPINNSAGLVCLSFNQDSSCIALGTTDGIRIYNIDTHQTCYRIDIGAIG
jgi:autophagy-related protein 18